VSEIDEVGNFSVVRAEITKNFDHAPDVYLVDFHGRDSVQQVCMKEVLVLLYVWNVYLDAYEVQQLLYIRTGRDREVRLTSPYAPVFRGRLQDLCVHSSCCVCAQKWTNCFRTHWYQSFLPLTQYVLYEPLKVFFDIKTAEDQGHRIGVGSLDVDLVVEY